MVDKHCLTKNCIPYSVLRHLIQSSHGFQLSRSFAILSDYILSLITLGVDTWHSYSITFGKPNILYGRFIIHVCSCVRALEENGHLKLNKLRIIAWFFFFVLRILSFRWFELQWCFIRDSKSFVGKNIGFCLFVCLFSIYWWNSWLRSRK